MLKLPTLVLFKDGHPDMYPYDASLTAGSVKEWLLQRIREEIPPSKQPSIELMENTQRATAPSGGGQTSNEFDSGASGYAKEQDEVLITPVSTMDGTKKVGAGTTEANFAQNVILQ